MIKGSVDLDRLFYYTWITGTETVLGYAAAIVLAVPLGLAIAFSRFLRQTIYPFFVSIEMTPKIAFAPLFISWLGFGLLPKVIIVFLVCFFPIVLKVLFFWAHANGWLPFYLDPAAHPVWFVLTLVAIPFWTSLHFYFIHRLLHWKPLYHMAHAVHHRNDNLGPWTGLSMHPVEHVIYLSSVLIHALVMSHPIHILFHMQWNTLGAATSHTGFESVTFRGRQVLVLGSFHHQLHHRHHDCNYGNPFMPWDRWFGSNHDGTPESWAAIRRRRRERAQPART